MDRQLSAYIEVRIATPGDLPEIERIQRESFSASRWDPADFLRYHCLVATDSGTLAGFIVARSAVPGETEILSVAVSSGFRRRRLATTLVRTILEARPGECFLEVRESNHAARSLYEGLGFSTVGMRPAYYNNPQEAAIVMRFQS